MTPIEPTTVPAISRLETAWRPPWLLTAMTQQGRPHHLEGENCQDSYRIGGKGDATWLLVADGVSSAGCSGRGSAMAVHYVDLYLYQEITATPASSDLLRKAFVYARNQIASHAAEDRRAINDYATTLLAALLAGPAISLARVGDGSVLTLEAGDVLASRIDCPNTRPSDGIVDLTHRDWVKHFRAEHIRDRSLEGISAVVLSTDGAEHFFLKEDPTRRIDGVPQRVSSSSVPGPFLRAKLKELTPLYIVDYLHQLLQFTKKDEFDDDVTFVMAAIPPEPPP